MPKEGKQKLSKLVKQKYANGYINPMKGKKRPDLAEYNRKYKSEQMKGENNPNKRPEVIAKRLKTIQGQTKEIYGLNGPDNCNWKGGVSFEEYGYEFNNELKYAIRLRDKFKCQICHKSENENNQLLSVHHIDYDKTNNNPANLVALCISCHTKTNSSRHYWIEYFARRFDVKMKKVTWNELKEECYEIAKFLEKESISGIIPIPRGGIVPAVIVSNISGIPLKEKVELVSDVILDEIVDFGVTFKRFKRKYPANLFVCLHLNRKHFKQKQLPDFFVREIECYIIYPWETDWGCDR